MTNLQDALKAERNAAMRWALLMDYSEAVHQSEQYQAAQDATDEAAANITVEIADTLTRMPELDNHHNAAMCPYCTKERLNQDRRVRIQTLRWAARQIDKGPDVPLRPSIFSTLLREWADDEETQ